MKVTILIAVLSLLLASCAPAAAPAPAPTKGASQPTAPPVAKPDAKPAAPSPSPKPAAEQPRSGGILNTTLGADMPSYDLHQEAGLLVMATVQSASAAWCRTSPPTPTRSYRTWPRAGRSARTAPSTPSISPRE